MKTSRIFHTVCFLCASAFIVLGLSPLATLAFDSPLANAPAESETADPANSIPAFAVISPDNNLPTDLPSVDTLPTYDAITVTERQKSSLPTGLPKVTPYYGDKIVYLTFDDGPEPENTAAILRILREHGIKATFFIVGVEAEKYPALVKQIFSEGHALGNHTYSHVYRDVYRSPAIYTAQLNHTDEIIKQITGVRPRISRAPGGTAGNFTKEYREALNKQGYISVDWNISSGDASRGKADQLIANILRQVENNKYLWSHAIVLMHDGSGHGETVKALPGIIKIFKDRGFEFRVINLQTPPAW